MNLVATRYVLAFCALTLTPVMGQAQAASRTAAPVATHEDVLVTLKKLVDAASPAGMNDKEGAEYATHTQWIKSAYDRVLAARERGSGLATGRSVAPVAGATSDVKAPRDVATGQSSGKRQHGVPARDIVKLVKTLEQEGRQFNTLSNASKSRHEMAMSSIRNMK